ncbi:hypothetical protein [Streptomyces griseosporeus]|uniref:hypothetical protein n=1 Tax=Streptomyces griseosporeus TaxID=1910 RepID=UPI0036F9C7F1
MSGRRAALPGAGYLPPQRLFVDAGECRVRVYNERDGSWTDFDLTELPVDRPLQEWFAAAMAAASGPVGVRRTPQSASDYRRVLRRFCAYLASLSKPPRTPAQLAAVHLDGFVLKHRGWPSLPGVLSSLRSLLRHAPRAGAEGFLSHLSQVHVPRARSTVQSYQKEEFEEITRQARRQVRAMAGRLEAGRRQLADWRAGRISREEDRYGWEEGWLLDHVERTGDFPRRPHSATRTPITMVRRHGGTGRLLAQLYLTRADVAAAAALMVCLTGENLSTIASATSVHHRPDGQAGGPASAMVDWLKPRRGPAHAHRTVTLQQSGASGGRWDLHSPFGLYTLLHDLGSATRARTGSNALFVYFAGTGPHGAGFRTGISQGTLYVWSKEMAIRAPGGGPETAMLLVDSRRLRLTWLELNQRPVAHSERTLANDYLARNRGDLASYQRVVADVLQQQVAKARALPLMTVMSEADLAEARQRPGQLAARLGLTADSLAEVLSGRQDTVLAACTSFRASPHAPPGRACPASFLLCLSCPCARATPQHVPLLALTLDKINARRLAMPPSVWASRYGIPASQLTDLLAQFSAHTVAAARAGCGEHEHDLVDRLLNRSLDQ